MSKNVPQKEAKKENNGVLPKKISINKSFIELVRKGVAIILVTTTVSFCTAVFAKQASRMLTTLIEESYINKEIDSYWNIINKLYLLIKSEYNPQTPYEWFAVMRALYSKEIFIPSVYYSNSQNETSSEPGMTTFTKNGVCRHINEFFTDFLKFVGYDAVSVNNLIGFSDEINSKPIKEKLLGNHIYTMVIHDDQIVIFDYINNLIFHKVDGEWQEMTYGTIATELRPITDLLTSAEPFKIFDNILFKSKSMTIEESNKIKYEYETYYSNAFFNVEKITDSKRIPFYLRVRNDIINDIDLINNGLENMPAFFKTKIKVFN